MTPRPPLARQVSIFGQAPVQILKMPPTRGPPALSTAKSGSQLLSSSPSASGLMGPPPPPPPSKEYLFGASRDPSWKETTSHELGRLEIFTVRQLQRALQQKIAQSTRNPMGVWTAFHKVGRAHRPGEAWAHSLS